MPATLKQSIASMAAHYQQRISETAAFVRSGDSEMVLLPPLGGGEPGDHRQALAHLVSLGFLNDYRYIDSNPTPTILAIRA